MTLYTTRTEAIATEIVEPIEAGEAIADEFDVEAIADEYLSGYADGYAPRPDVDFWTLVEKHAR